MAPAGEIIIYKSYYGQPRYFNSRKYQFFYKQLSKLPTQLQWSLIEFLHIVGHFFGWDPQKRFRGRPFKSIIIEWFQQLFSCEWNGWTKYIKRNNWNWRERKKLCWIHHERNKTKTARPISVVSTNEIERWECYNRNVEVRRVLCVNYANDHMIWTLLLPVKSITWGASKVLR